LIRFVGCNADELAAVAGEFITDGFQHLCALVARLRTPLGTELLGLSHGLVDGIWAGYFLDTVLAWVIIQSIQRPNPVGMQRWVCIRLIDEAANRWCLAAIFFRPAVLITARTGKDVSSISDCAAESLFLLLQRSQAFFAGLIRCEQGVEEVLLRGVFFQASHQVG